MKPQLARKAASAFMAFTLVLTCNSATMQPLAAFAANGADARTAYQEAPQDGATEASPDTSGPAADGAREGETSDDASGNGAVSDRSDEDQGPRDLSAGDGEPGFRLTGVAYLRSDGMRELVETQDGRVDVSDADAATAWGWELLYLIAVDPRNARTGDFFTLDAPSAPFELAPEAELRQANGEHAALAMLSVEDGAVHVGLSAEAANANAPFDLEVRVPVALAADALGEEPATAMLPLANGATAMVVLPAKPHPAQTASGALAPTAPDEGLQMQDAARIPTASLSVAQPAAAEDVTNELDQLDLELATLLYVDAAGKEHEIKPTGSTYDFSNVPLSTISELRMEVDFSVLKDDGNRTIKEGEQFHYRLPAQLFKAEDVDAEQVIASPAGETIAVYTIKDNVVTVTFKQAVNLDEGNVDIVGGVDCTFQLNHDGLSDDEPTSAEMTLQEGGTTYTFTAPKKTSDLAGIEKTGAYDKDDGTVTWTITVGSDPESAGVPLRGITVTDAYDKAAQTGAKVTDAEGNGLSVTETAQGFAYTFPEDSTAAAPYAMIVTARVSDSVFERAVNGDQVLANEARMSSPSSSTVKVTGEPSATGTVEVKRYGLSKLGTPLSSDTIAWDLTVNQGGTGAARDVAVYDRLDSRAKYKENTLKVNGTAVDVYPSAPSPAPTGTYAIVTDEPGGTQLLEVRFNGTVSDERRIAFETSITTPDDQKDAAIDFPNSAWMTYAWPSGYGVGPGMFEPIGVTADFQVAYVNKETSSYDASTGEITWTIKPSVRTDNYESGIITDVINDDQEYVAQSVKVRDKGIELTAEQVAGVFSYDETLKLLTFSFASGEYALNDIEIEYRTQALDFQRENMTTHLYEDSANLSVLVDGAVRFTDEDSASRSIMNRFLAKNSFYQVVDDSSGSTGYLHYQIVVNGSHMPCANLHVTDDLSQLATEVLDGSGNKLCDIEASKWNIVADGERAVKVTEIDRSTASRDVTSSYATGEWIANRSIDATFSNDAPTTNAYRIDFYLALDKETLLDLHRQHPEPFSISATNKAQAGSDGFDGGAPVEADCVGKTDGGEIDNRLVSKSVDGSRQGEGLLRYRIDVNPNGTDLRGAILTDVPDPSLSIDASSVKLYRAQHGPNGAISPVLGDEADASLWGKKLVHNADADCTALQVSLPDGTASYVLLYDARVVSAVKGGTASNKATLTVGGDEMGSDVCTAEVDASSWGWLTKKAVYKLVKADEFGGKASPIAGVTFDLFSDKEKKNLVATAVSNAKGLVAFYGLDQNAVYYYDETAVPSGYQALAYDATVNQFTTGAMGSNVVAGTATLNKRTTGTVPVEIVKTFDDAAGHVANPQSSFKLYLYPNGFGNAKKVPVDATGSDGVYRYAASGVAAELANNAVDGTLKISGLPWGDYGLEEVNPCGGYAAYEGMRYFSVKAPVEASGPWAVDYAPTGTDRDVGAGAGGTGALANRKTALTVRKTTESGNDLRGAVLSVYLPNDDGAKGPEKAVNPFFAGDRAMTVTIADSSPVATFDWDLSGIPVGTYWLCEDAAPADPDVGRFEDVKFEVDRHGKLSVLSGGGTAEGSTLTVVDESNQATVRKVDQWGAPVAGATLQLQVNDGPNWTPVGDAKESDDTGTALVFGGLERGKTYRIVETTVPDGFETASHEAHQTVEFTVDEYGQAKDIDLHNGSAPADSALGIFQNECSGNDFTMRNERIVGHAQFTKRKTDLDGTNPVAVAKAEFDLYRVGADGVDAKVNKNGRFASGADGRVSTVGSVLQNALTGEAMSRGLAPGSYYFQEAVGRDVVNSGREADYRATFEVEADGGNRYTWSDGSEPSAIDAEVAQSGGTSGNTMDNASLNAQVELKKIDADDAAKPVVGATYELRDCASASAAQYTVVDRQKTSRAGSSFANAVRAVDALGNKPTATATADGELFFVNVPALAEGHVYKVVETAPAPGYEKDATEYEVEAIDPTAPNRLYHLKDVADSTVSDKQNSFTLAKSVEPGDGNASRFTVEPAGSSTFADGSTEAITLDLADGTATVQGLLVAGSVYTVSETVPPVGYQAAPSFQIVMSERGTVSFNGSHPDVKLDSSGGNQVVTVTDFATKASLGKKAVGSEALLAGAQFQIDGTFADGAESQTVTTGTSPVELDKKLVAEREYRISETVPAPGCISSPWTDTYRDARLDDGKLVVKLTARGRLQYETASSSWADVVDNALVMRDERNAFTLKKADADGNALAGASFELSGSFVDGSSKKTLLGEGASEGTLTGQLVAGATYRVRETKPPEGCAAVADFEVAMRDDGTVTSSNAPDGVAVEGHAVTVRDEPSSVSIAKKDADGATFVAGAAFELAGRFASDERASIGFTSSGAEPDGLGNGLFEGKLIAGETYTLVETVPPAGYVVSLPPTNLSIDAAGALYAKAAADPDDAWAPVDGTCFTVIDRASTLTVDKAGEAGKPVTGTVFELTGDFALAKGGIVWTVGADGDASHEVSGELRAWIDSDPARHFAYTLTEISPAPGYAVAAPVTLRMLPDGTLQQQDGDGAWAPVENNELTVRNALNGASFAKANEDGSQLLAGARFELKPTSGAFPDGSATKSFATTGGEPAGATDGRFDGALEAHVEGDASTEYALTETAPAPGYVVSPWTCTYADAALAEGGSLVVRMTDRGALQYRTASGWTDVAGNKLVMKDARNRFTFKKADAGGAPLKGAAFQLTGTFAGDEGETTRTLLAGASEETLEGRLVAGNDYELTESVAPDGYAALVGSASLTCGADGSLAFRGEAPDGVSLDEARTGVTVANEPIGFSFGKLERYAESCADAVLCPDGADATRPLEGAEFTAFDDEECTRVAQTGDGKDMKASSDADGKVSFSLVKAGTRYLKETATPAGHVPDATVYRLDVASDGTVERFAPAGEDGVLDAVVNDVHRTDIRIKKVAETDEGKALPNSTYGLFRRADSPLARGGGPLQLIAKAVTDASGCLVFKGVLMGREYVIQELEAPDGSLVSKRPIALSFAVGDDGDPKLVSFDDGSGTAEMDENGGIVWKEPQVIVEFSKKGPDGAALAGATLQVVDEAGAAIGEPWVSGEGADRRIEGVLAAGRVYRLVELDAPDGYAVAEDVAFEVDALARGPQEGYVQHVEMVDALAPAAPAEASPKPQASKGPFGFLARTGDVPLGLLAGGAALAAAGIAAAVGVRRRRKRA